MCGGWAQGCWGQGCGSVGGGGGLYEWRGWMLVFGGLKML